MHNCIAITLVCLTIALRQTLLVPIKNLFYEPSMLSYHLLSGAFGKLYVCL